MYGYLRHLPDSKSSQCLAEDHFGSSIPLLRDHLLFTKANSDRENSSLLLPCVIEDKTAHKPHKLLCDVQPLGLEGTLGPLKKCIL